MRVLSRIALIVLVVLLAVPSYADHFIAECPLTQVGINPATTAFVQSPHGVFRFGSQVYVLRGQTLTTYAVTDLGDLQIAREDFIGALGAREANGGVAFSNGMLFVSAPHGRVIALGCRAATDRDVTLGVGLVLRWTSRWLVA